MRDDFKEAAKRLLAQRAGYRCSNSDCGAATAGPFSEPQLAVNMGIAAHINAASPGGPRFDSAMTVEECVAPENGIWLCPTHASEIDRDEKRFPASLLRDRKIRSVAMATNAIGLQDRIEKAEGSSTVSEIDSAVRFRSTDVAGRFRTDLFRRKEMARALLEDPSRLDNALRSAEAEPSQFAAVCRTLMIRIENATQDRILDTRMHAEVGSLNSELLIQAQR